MGASAASTSSSTSSPNAPPPLPSKLRWRPYKNGTSVKSKSARIEQQEAARAAKGMASNARSKQYYANKRQSPIELSLQWEEAETLETMSHGGLPHNTHTASDSHGRANSRQSSPAFTSPQSPNSTSSNSGSVSSSPSPTSTKLDLVVDGAPALAQFRATLPVFVGSDPQQILATSQLSNSTAYQVALELLLQNHRQQNASTALLQSSSTMATSTSTAPTTAPGQFNSKALPPYQQPPPIHTASLFGLDAPSLSNPALSEPTRKLSNADIMDIADVDDLLASCGFLDQAVSAQPSASVSTKPVASPGFFSGYLASPEMSDHSMTTSPMSDVIDFARSQGTSPLPSFAPLGGADGLSLEALFDPTAIAAAENTASITPPSSQDPYQELILQLASPFSAPELDATKVNSTLLATSGTVWPSLFPSADTSSSLDEVVKQPSALPGRSEISTQTSAPYPSPLSSASSIRSNSTTTNVNSEVDPDWLNFLDEASLSEADLAALLSDTETASPSSSPNTSPQQARAGSRSLWGWAGDVLKGSNQTPTATQQQQQQQDDPFASAASGGLGNISMSGLPGGPPPGHRGMIPISGSLIPPGPFTSQSNGLITTLSKRPQRMGLHTKPLGVRASEGEANGGETERKGTADRPELELKDTQRQRQQQQQQQQQQQSSRTESPRASPEPPSSILSKAPGSKVPVGCDDDDEDVGGLLTMLKSWWNNVKPY